MNQKEIIINRKGPFDDDYIEYESNGNKGKTLSIVEYLNMVIPYLRNIIDNHKDGWKIQLTAEVTFVPIIKDSDKDSDEDFGEDSAEDPDKKFSEPYTIDPHSENSSILIGYKTDNVIKQLFKSLLKEYQESLKTKIKRSDLLFNSVDSLYYRLHKISLNKGGSYIDSLEWIKTKKQQ